MKIWIAIIAATAQLFCLPETSCAAPYTRIVSPTQNQSVPGPDVKIKFEAGDMDLGPSASNLHFMLDDQPFQVQYDGNHAHVFKDVMPGTHTVRVFAANVMQEAIPGTQSTVSFSVGYPDRTNYIMPGRPTLTYNLPQGEYLGIDAADVTVDFIVENVSLSPGGYQVAYYADGRRFLVHNQCGPHHLKGLAPGYHRVKIELQDRNGDLLPGPFNSTERVILISPDQVEKSPSPVDDGYHGLPRIDSIKGSMTMGQSWSATEPVPPLSPADIQKQAALTVHKTNGDTVNLRKGTLLNPDEAAGVSEQHTEVPMKAPVNNFSVRQSGPATTQAPSVDLDQVDTDTVRRGTIEINHDKDATVVRATEAEGTVPADQPEAEMESIKATTASLTTRRRADGTTTTVRRTTATLRLEDRPGYRVKETETTRTTVRPENNRTTATTVDTKTTATTVDTKTTASSRERGNRGNRRNRGNKSHTRRNGKTPPSPTLK